MEDTYFTYNNEDAHGILMFFEVEKISGKLTPNGEDAVDIQFFVADSLSQANVHRSCWNILKYIQNLN